MRVNVGRPWQGLVETLVEKGRYASADEVVEDGLRLIREREDKLAWLRAKVARSLDGGGDLSDADVDRALQDTTERLRARGL